MRDTLLIERVVKGSALLVGVPLACAAAVLVPFRVRQVPDVHVPLYELAQLVAIAVVDLPQNSYRVFEMYADDRQC